jgi:hypothetical protein
MSATGRPRRSGLVASGTTGGERGWAGNGPEMKAAATGKVGRHQGASWIPSFDLKRRHHGTTPRITAAPHMVAKRSGRARARFGSAGCTPGGLLVIKFDALYWGQRGRGERRRRRQHEWKRRTDGRRRCHESCGRHGWIEQPGWDDRPPRGNHGRRGQHGWWGHDG